MSELGTQIVLTVVPHTHSCRQKIETIANFIHYPFIYVDWHGLTSFDQGGHLDHQGAIKFTDNFLNSLEKMGVFKNLMASHQA